MGKTSPASLRRPSSFQQPPGEGRAVAVALSDKVMEALLLQKNQGKLSNSALGKSGIWRLLIVNKITLFYRALG